MAAGTRDDGRPPDVATLEEVCQAIEDLGPGDVVRLKRAAMFLVESRRALGHRIWAGDGDDLFQEAAERMLDGSRQWPGKVPFVTFYRKTMWSILSGWEKQDPPGGRAPQDHSSLSRSTDSLPAQDLDPETAAAVDEQVRAILALCKDDAEKAYVQGHLQGMTGSETQAAYGLSHEEYEAARKRFAGKIRRLKERGE